MPTLTQDYLRLERMAARATRARNIHAYNLSIQDNQFMLAQSYAISQLQKSQLKATDESRLFNPDARYASDEAEAMSKEEWDYIMDVVLTRMRF
jgi:hypothetical protein